MQNPYANYANNKIQTASGGELTLMLYEGAIKFCNIAIIGIEKKDIEKSHINLVKVQKIIEYLQSTLDERYEVSKEFDRIYDYLLKQLVAANMKKDKAIVEEVCNHLREIRDNWIKVMKESKVKGVI